MQKRSKSPHGTVSVQSFKSRLRLVWTCPVNRKRKYLYLALPDSHVNRIAAQQKALQIQGDIGTGNYDVTLDKYKSPRQLDRDRPTVVKLFEQWIEYKRHGVAPKTLEKFRATVKYVERHFRSLKADQVGESQAQDFSQALVIAGLGEDQRKRRLEELKACWRWAIERKILIDNPWVEVHRRVKVPPRRDPQPFTSQEIGAILQTFRTDPRLAHYGDYLEFLLGSGTRLGEAAGLRWRHTNRDCSVVWIGECLTRGKRRPAKGNKSRELKLSTRLQVLILSRRPAPPEPDGLVFPSPTGVGIDDHNFRNRCWKPVLERLGISYRPPKNTRHSFVSHSLDRGMNPLEIGAITGHSQKTLHERYSGLIKSSPSLPEVL